MPDDNSPDVELRMDHDTVQGVCDSIEPFGLECLAILNSKIVKKFSVEKEGKRDYKIYDERVDESAVKDHLSDLGYL